MRQQAAQSLAGLLHSPDYLFKRAMQRAVIPDNDPQLRQPTPRSMMALKLEDARAYYAAAYRPDLTTIVVVGDVTPQDARRVVEADFGGWAAPRPEARDRPARGRSEQDQHRACARQQQPAG